MQFHTELMNALASRLKHERLVQNLSREQLAAVCGVSPSFIRDAESNPGRCSLVLMLQLIQGLGLKATISGWNNDTSASGPAGMNVQEVGR